MVFPFVIGRFFSAQGADALPAGAFALAVATFGALMAANYALGHVGVDTVAQYERARCG